MMTVGKIEFGNIRYRDAMGALSEALMERQMWMEEAQRKDEEIERLKKLLEDINGIQKPGVVRKPRVVRKSRAVRK